MRPEMTKPRRHRTPGREGNIESQVHPEPQIDNQIGENGERELKINQTQGRLKHEEGGLKRTDLPLEARVLNWVSQLGISQAGVSLTPFAKTCVLCVQTQIFYI